MHFHATTTKITSQKMKFSIKDFLSQCDQIRKKLRIRSHLLKKSLMENFIFCAVDVRSRIHRIITNIYNNKQKKLKDSVRKDSAKVKVKDKKHTKEF